MKFLSASIHSLCLAHWPTPLAEDRREATGFVVETCQRHIEINPIANAPTGPRKPEVFYGSAAYEFLLEVLTGLRSEVLGETNIYGQFKEAWRRYQVSDNPRLLEWLSPIVQSALADAKLIHQTHLQSIGGTSYGSLLRKLLRPRKDERILFVGSGNLARSLTPFFRQWPSAYWNRREPRTHTGLPVHRFTSTQVLAAAQWADHLVITTPADIRHDQQWLSALSDTPTRSLMHFGRRRAQHLAVPSVATCYDLDHLFELQNKQANVRSLGVQQARIACRVASRRFEMDWLPRAAPRRVLA